MNALKIGAIFGGWGLFFFLLGWHRGFRAANNVTYALLKKGVFALGPRWDEAVRDPASIIDEEDL